MMKTRRFVVAFALLTVSVSARPIPAVAASDRPMACIYADVGSPGTRAAGFRGTSVYSYDVAGPGVIHYTATRSAAQNFGASASVGFDIGAFIAKSEVTFSVNYSRTTTTTEAWGYDTTIPSGWTGRMAVLHRNDRISYTETIHHEDCSTTRRTGYSYVPLADTSNLSYCIIRDLTPFSFSNWRPACVGE